MIDNETIDKIRSQIDIAVVIGETVELKQRSGNLLGLCPFHTEKTPSFSVSPGQNFYHCFGCGASGDALKFVMETRGLSFPEAVEFLADRLGIEVKHTGVAPRKESIKDKHRLYSINLAAHKFFKHSLNIAGDTIKSYVTERGLVPDTLRSFGVGYAPASWQSLRTHLNEQGYSDADILLAGLIRRNTKGDIYDTFRNRLMFPVSMDGKRILGFGGRIVPGVEDDRDSPKYLNSMETPLYQKSKILYGYPQALTAMKAEQAVYLVEGYLDVIGLSQAGVKNVVATCGTAVTPQHIKRLAYVSSKVIVLFDGDRAGKAAAAKSFKLFINAGIDGYACFLEDGEDPDSIAKVHAEGTKEFLDQSPLTHLFNCHLQQQIQQAGVDRVNDLGAAAKGKLCEDVAKILDQVTNNYERDLLIGKAASELQVERGLFSSQVKVQRPVSKLEEVAMDLAENANVAVNDLPAFDRLLLNVVMTQKELVTREVLHDSNMCQGLHPTTLGFIEDVDIIFSDPDLSEAEKKDLVKTVLVEKGASWVAHWKKSYNMLEDVAVDMNKTFLECKQAFRRLSLQAALGQARELLKTSTEEETKVDLSARIVKLSRELQEITLQT